MSTILYADDGISFLNLRFENDVKVDGTQTVATVNDLYVRFENDVKVDGTQTLKRWFNMIFSLRMM